MTPSARAPLGTNRLIGSELHAAAMMASACVRVPSTRNCATEKGSPGAARAMAPCGRPPAEHVFDAESGGWVHKQTRRPFDAEAHAARVHAKKVACLRDIYWERGGRQKRLARYVRKRASKHSQQTLDGAFARAAPPPSSQPEGGGEASVSGSPTPPPFMPAAPREVRACTSPPSPPPSEQERGTSW